ncbi:peptidoglycan DD-metalloendopeptidase family protein [Rhodovulum steppense]|uniref:Murein DD-endopeptidase MepM/ murein hydrolase activator NlpD n=1 Tax=Rhodovulum steppense TaxID=540251 RepID=A0A4R1YPH5_9RHOB|nr:peptidoglycan DD-metalloendopeptidase family protein [Rhodovulum steppense]TCM80513.1 murein DD-endopeptidase MepM/ murein hydrolase activator NlpD [Rhodovulum steppense]
MSISDHAARLPARVLALGLGAGLLAGCESGWDYDFRDMGGSGAQAVRVESGPRPDPDSRGVISYANYQVAVARRGDNLGDVANRVGLPAEELARHNGISRDARLREGEIIALPRRVPDGGTAIGGLRSDDRIDITNIAGDAIQRSGQQSASAVAPAAPRGQEPVRHRVERGETAYSIARLYNVTPRALADWNGLGPDMAVREGQFLLIPTPAREVAAAPAVVATRPGAGSAAPTPPSAATPLPREQTTTPAAAPPPTAAAPASPQMKSESTTQARFAMPVQGSIIRGYQKGKNDGIDISARAGSPVKAAADGTVAAITRDTEQVPILVVRHPDNMLSVYANIDGIAVEKGATVKRGQTLAQVRAGNPAFLHFEIRKGFESVDPMPYLTP